MRKNEVELIAALAEGRLEDETAARVLINSSPKHRAEYEAQKAAYEALSSIPPAKLTEHETAALHRDIWAELQARPLPTTVKTPWYYRWSYAAAGLFLVVGLVIVVDQTNPNFAPTALLSSDDAGTEAFAEEGSGLDTPDTTSADASAPAITESAAADDAAPEETDGVARSAAPNLTGLAELAEQTRIGELKLYDVVASDLDQSIVEDMTSCIESAGLIDHEVVGDVERENRYIVAVPTGIELGPETPISFVDANTCELILTDG
jgi:hypothetical protein